MTALAQLGAHVSQGARGGLSGPLRDLVKLHVIDTVTAWIATAVTQEAQALRRFEREGAPEHGDPALAILINCALTRMSEIDDIHLASMITPGSIVIPATLSIAATLSTNPAALQDAIVAGYEAMIRLGLALDGPTILYRGIWPSYFAAPFGVAAAAARLFDLSSEQTAHALALALTMSAPGVGHHNAPTGARWFAAGSMARNGLLAAQAARAGFTSDINILEGSFFNTVFGITPKVAAFTDGLGDKPKLGEVSFKPWCAARQTMAATQAVREILDGGVAASDITAIEVVVPPPFLKMIDHGTQGGRFARLTSQHYQIAAAVLAPELAFDVAQTREIPGDVRAFMNKVTVRASDDVLDGFPGRWSARVHIRASGAEHERLVGDIPGDPRRPFGMTEVIDKARRFVGPMADEIAAQCVAVLDGRATPAQLLEFVKQACSRPCS
jgi:2-methylcitrate dehydratase PrpD